MPRIGERIRLARLAQGLTIRKLSDLTGYTELTVGDIERGKYIPTDRLLGSIERALKTQFRK